MKESYVNFLNAHAKKPLLNCHSCKNCSRRPAYGGEHIGWLCSKGIDETNPDLFFDGTDYEEIECEHYDFDGDMDLPDRETVFNIMKGLLTKSCEMMMNLSKRPCDPRDLEKFVNSNQIQVVINSSSSTVNEEEK